MKSRYDISIQGNDARNTNLFEMDVCEISYTFRAEKGGDLQHRKAQVIAADTRDAVRTVGEALPRGTTFNVVSFDQRIATITAISPIRKREIYDFLKAEYEDTTKSKLFTKRAKGKK